MDRLQEWQVFIDCLGDLIDVFLGQIRMRRQKVRLCNGVEVFCLAWVCACRDHEPGPQFTSAIGLRQLLIRKFQEFHAIACCRHQLAKRASGHTGGRADALDLTVLQSLG